MVCRMREVVDPSALDGDGRRDLGVGQDICDFCDVPSEPRTHKHGESGAVLRCARGVHQLGSQCVQIDDGVRSDPLKYTLPSLYP